jgi:hypothetical protein
VPLYWQQWVECWQKDQDGQEHPHLVSAGVELDLLGLARGDRTVPVSQPDAGTKDHVMAAPQPKALPAPAGNTAFTAVTGERS